MTGCCSYKCVKRSVIFFNVFFWFTGPGMLSLGTWYMLNIKIYSPVVDKGLYIIPAYVVMAAGVAVTMFGIIGCLGAINDNRCMISFFFTFVLIAFGCEVFSTVKSFLVYDKVSSSIEMRLEYSMKYQYHYNTEHSDVINSIQRELNCCGLHKYSDWQYYRYYTDISLAVARGRETVPVSCCRDTAGISCNVGNKVPRDLTQIYTKGCHTALENWMQSNMLIFGWTCFAMSSVQILGMVLCCCFYKAMKDTRR
ncbi:tetraspanin-3-like [Mytilus galloprovincialis]|uniref:tetraspanin-3-like n=1 Tax=Mytilus galloprovincialis TaxID=29158 RepID=UPI003F7CAD06